MIAPQQEITQLIYQIEHHEIQSIEEINERFQWLHQNYYQLEWTWAWEMIQKWYKLSLETITAQEVIHIVRIWKEAVVHLDHLLYEDAKKEFSMISQTSFGVDGDYTQKKIDFEQVRGAFESNTFVKAVEQHIQAKTALGEELIARLQPLTHSSN